MTIFFDFDSTLVGKESLDEVITRALHNSPERDTVAKTIADITQAGMEGTLPFTQSVEQRLAATPLHRTHFIQTGIELVKHITPGMPELFTELTTRGYTVYIISGGFRESISPVANLLGLPETRVFCNQCFFASDGTVTGVDTSLSTFTDHGKTPVINHIEQTDRPPRPFIMVGDGANDLAAYERGAVDYFCGFTEHVTRDIIRSRAPHQVATSAALRDFIFSREAV